MNVIKRYGDHRELHVLTHSIPTRHASDLNSLMRPLFPSAAVREQKYALISSLRAQGSPIRSLDADKPGPDSVFLIAEGETPPVPARTLRSEEHTSELQSLMRTSYAVFCLKKKIYRNITTIYTVIRQ